MMTKNILDLSKIVEIDRITSPKSMVDIYFEFCLLVFENLLNEFCLEFYSKNLVFNLVIIKKSNNESISIYL